MPLGGLGLIDHSTDHVTGDGFVVEQDPAPGTPVDVGAGCRVVLARTLPGIQQ